MAGQRRLRREDYTVGWVCALPIELAAAQEMLDEKHDDSDCDASNSNIYTLGRIGQHNVVIACLPEGQIGTNSATAVAIQMKTSFPSIRFGVLVGIGGGVPSAEADIRLGDVVVSRPEKNHGGVVQYDFGKRTPSGFERTGFLNAPPEILQYAVATLQANHMRGNSRVLEYASKFDSLPTFTQDTGPDVLFESDYDHVGGTTCEQCNAGRAVKRTSRIKQEVVVHYGTIASGNQVMRDGAERDRVSSALGGALCFEMEGAGLMNKIPCLVIRGICDYADSHKNKRWQPYAAGVAAAYTKDLLSVVPPAERRKSRIVEEIVTDRRAFFTVPFQRDDKFVGRESTMAEIDQRFQSAGLNNHMRVALVGIGGIGKSQIAIEYAYRARLRDPKLSVFWIYASNTARYEQAYRDLADQINLPNRADPTVDIFQLVYRWLSDDTNGHWLIILDNADDDSMFFQGSEVTDHQSQPTASAKTPLIASLPRTSNGSVIVTSRDWKAATNLIGIYENMIRVDVMDELDALELLQTKVALDEDSLVDAKTLIQVLGSIPLAITHAGSYIKMRLPRITISTYLMLLQENEASLITLIDNIDIKDPRRDSSSQRAVTATWQISFDQIQRSKPEASDLLVLMSMFDRQGIPEYLLQGDMTQLQFEDAISPLISFSLIKEGKGRQSIEIHRLVQISIRRWLESNNQLVKWIIRSAEIMATAFPDGNYETWAVCQVLLPHAREIMRHTQNGSHLTVEENFSRESGWYRSLKGKLMRHPLKTTPDSLNWAVLGTKAGWYLFLRGDYEEAEAMYRCAFQGHEKILGPEHPDTLASASHLGCVFERQGKYEEAEALHQHILQGFEKVLGPEHPDTLTSVNNLGSALERQGKYKEAAAMYQYALRGCEKVLGPEHPYTLTSVNNLGSVLEGQAKYKEAEAMYQHALQGYKKVLGPKHPHTLASASNLVLVLKRLGKYEEAEAMHQNTLQRQ